MKAAFLNYPALKQAGLRFLQGLAAYPVGALRGNAITTYWGFRNFGDLITPLLLKKIGYTPINSARVSLGQFVFVGSILDSIQEDYKGIILGSGFLSNKRPKKLRKATVLGVRGALTKHALGINEDVQLGDAGLLLARFITIRPKPTFTIGIVPHYMDSADNRIADLIQRFGADAKVIDVCRPPEAVFADICSCQCIASSSLHGLVVADSLGLPNLWLKLSGLGGNGEFKFHDYYSAFGEERTSYVPSGNESLKELQTMMVMPPKTVQYVVDRLHELFLSITEYFPHRVGFLPIRDRQVNRTR